MEEGKVELVKKEMQKTFATKLSEKQQIYTPNLMLNAVINEKKEICEKNHIRFVIHVKLPENIDTIELAIALSNLLDNAIEAEQKEQEQESRKVELNTSKFSWLPDLNANVGQNFDFGRSPSKTGVIVDQNSANTSASVSLSMPILRLACGIPNPISLPASWT